jgi:hypothetical protein
MEWSPSKRKRMINLWKWENSKNRKRGVKQAKKQKEVAKYLDHYCMLPAEKITQFS